MIAMSSAGIRKSKALIGQPCQMPLKSLKNVD